MKVFLLDDHYNELKQVILENFDCDVIGEELNDKSNPRAIFDELDSDLFLFDATHYNDKFATIDIYTDLVKKHPELKAKCLFLMGSDVYANWNQKTFGNDRNLMGEIIVKKAPKVIYDNKVNAIKDSLQASGFE